MAGTDLSSLRPRDIMAPGDSRRGAGRASNLDDTLRIGEYRWTQDGSQTPRLPGVSEPAPFDEERLKPGACIAGRYELRGLLGRGGMGVVFLAYDRVLGADVALKFICSDLGEGASGLVRLRDEVQLAQKISHPQVCRTYDLEEFEELFFVKMEYVAGETLAQRMDRAPRLSVAESLELAQAIAAGLEAAHAQGVVHCDLKPQNILLEHGTHRVVLMDFGIARVGARRYATLGRGAWGTPGYMAPEQAAGRKLDARADLYALGCILYELIVGEVPDSRANTSTLGRYLPLPGPNPRRRRPDLPRWLAHIIRRLLAPDPRQRYRSATALRAALAEQRGRSRRSVVRWTAVALAVGVVAVAVLGLTRLMSRRGQWHPLVQVRLPTYDEEAGRPAISPDGRWLAYTSNRDGRWRLYVESLQGGLAHALAWEGRLNHASWMHDGKALLGVTADYRVMRIPLEVTGGPSQEVARNAFIAEDCAGHLVLATLALHSCANCIRLIVREGGGPTGADREILRLPEAMRIHGLRCDREGRRIVYAASNRTGAADHILTGTGNVYLLGIDGVNGGDARQLTGGDESTGVPIFSGDGKSILYQASVSAGPSELREISIEGKEPVSLSASSSLIGGLDVSPDGKLLIFDDVITAIELHSYDLESKDDRRIDTTFSNVTQPRLTSDGRAVLVQTRQRGRGYAALLSVDGPAEHLLTEADVVAVDPNGHEFVYVLNAGQSARVRSMPLAGGAGRDITSIPGRVNALTVDRQGWIHMMIHGERHTGAWRVRVSGGEAVREGPEGATFVYPAPAGGWTLVAYEPPDTLAFRWRLVAPGASLDLHPAKVFDSTLYVTWASDGESFFSWDGREVHRYSVTTRAEQPLPLIPSSSIWGLAPTHDGKRLLVAADRIRKTRRMITNFGDRPRPLEGWGSFLSWVTR